MANLEDFLEQMYNQYNQTTDEETTIQEDPYSLDNIQTAWTIVNGNYPKHQQNRAADLLIDAYQANRLPNKL